jgi:putative DNA primase/helicase
MAALRRDRLWPDVAAPRHQYRKTKPRRSSADTRRYLLSIWRQCKPISDTPAERYLRNRAITCELPASLRYHPALKHTDTGLFLPAMVAAVQAPDRSITGLHRTFLRSDGNDKAPVSNPRKMLGQAATGAVRLAAAGPELAIGEGIETALSFMQRTGVPAWAALSSAGVRAIMLPPPPLASTVYLLTDLDKAGELAVQIAAERLCREGRDIKIARPVVGKDMNDAIRETANVRE